MASCHHEAAGQYLLLVPFSTHGCEMLFRVPYVRFLNVGCLLLISSRVADI